MSESWDDASRTVRRTVATPGGVVTLPIDVSQIFTAFERLVEQMDEAARVLAEADGDATELKVNYELSYARAVLTAKGRNKEEREAVALLEVEDVFSRWMQADRVMRAAKEATYTLKNKMSAYQTMAGMVREGIKGSTT